MPYAGFAASQARKSMHSLSAKGIKRKNSDDDNAHVMQNVIDLTGEDETMQQLAASPRPPRLVQQDLSRFLIRLESPQPKKIKTESAVQDQENGVIFVGETKQPPVNLKAKMKKALFTFEILRLTDVQRGVAEMRHARSSGHFRGNDDLLPETVDSKCDPHHNLSNPSAQAIANQQQQEEVVNDFFINGVPVQVFGAEMGTRLEFTPQVATADEMKDFKLAHKFSEISKKKIEIPPKIANNWFEARKLTKIPRDFFMLNGGVTREGCEPFILGDYTGFIPHVEGLAPDRVNLTRYIRDKNGHVLAAAYLDKRGNKIYKHPVVYFYHEDGFVIACKLTWVARHKRANDIESGNVEVLGERMYSFPSSKTPFKGVFIRSYTAMRATPNEENYMKVTLYSDVCSKHRLTFTLSSLGLATCVSKRPEGYIADHFGERQDDSLQNLGWKPSAENSLAINLHPDRNAAHKNYKLSAKYFDAKLWGGTTEIWFLFLNGDGDEIYVNGKGTVVYNKTQEHCISIQKKEYRSGFVKMRISIPIGRARKPKTMDFGRFCLMSFISRPLLPEETCDHGNQNREDNSYNNLFPRHRLFQGFNKAIHHTGTRPDGSVVGVYKAGDYWVASVRMYTPDGPTRTKEVLAYFSITDLGNKLAQQEAIVVRKRFTLRDGMCFKVPERVLVLPAIDDTLNA